MENNFNYNNYTNPYGYGDRYTPQYQKPQTGTYAFVNGIEGAKGYQLKPGATSVLLMDADGYLCYMKALDKEGKPIIRYFKLEEVDEAAARKLLQPSSPTDNYATKDDIEAINKKMDELLKRLESKGNSRKDNNV